jgi:hypothetical protein
MPISNGRTKSTFTVSWSNFSEPASNSVGLSAPSETLTVFLMLKSNVLRP